MVGAERSCRLDAQWDAECGVKVGTACDAFSLAGARRFGPWRVAGSPGMEGVQCWLNARPFGDQMSCFASSFDAPNAIASSAMPTYLSSTS